MTNTNQKIAAPESDHVRRMAARLRRILAAAPAGLPRGQLRNKLNSREKYLFDTAIGLLVAVGDVEVSPAAQRGTLYGLTESARQYVAVAAASDRESPALSTESSLEEET